MIEENTIRLEFGTLPGTIHAFMGYARDILCTLAFLLSSLDQGVSSENNRRLDVTQIDSSARALEPRASKASPSQWGGK